MSASGGVLVEVRQVFAVAHLRFGYQFSDDNVDAMQRTIEFACPKIKKLTESRVLRKHIPVLPEVFLQQELVIRHVVVDVRRYQPPLANAWHCWK